jgi:hypothetical protein
MIVNTKLFIYCSVHTDRFNELLKYMYTIRLGSKRMSGSGWIQYDEQYRLRKAMNPSSSWSIMDSELWLLYYECPENEIFVR